MRRSPAFVRCAVVAATVGVGSASAETGNAGWYDSADSDTDTDTDSDTDTETDKGCGGNTSSAPLGAAAAFVLGGLAWRRRRET